jgi:hypothetical protein
MDRKTEELLDLWMSYAIRRTAAKASDEGTLAVRQEALADQHRWEGKDRLFSDRFVRAAMVQMIEEGRCEAGDG